MKQNRLIILALIVLSLLPLVGFLPAGLPVTHDGQDHVARIANFYASLREGIIVPRWAANLNWGYGHPILMFLYPLPSYLASVFHMIGFSLVDSTKLVFAGSFVASIIAMYLWMSKAFGKPAGFVGALLYGFAPYRFVDLFVRGALGEHIAFVFPPLIFYFLYLMTRRKSEAGYNRWSFWGVSFTITALIFAHNAITIMFFPIIIIYIAYLAMFETKQKQLFVFKCVLALVAGFGLSAFFWIPAYFEGKYTLRDIVTAGEALQRFVPWQWFLYSPWNYGGGDQLTKSLGFVQWIGIVASLIYIRKTKERNMRIFLIGALIILVGSLFIMTSWSAFIWKHISLLQKFQFPWRFLSVSVFVASIVGGVAFDRLPRGFRYSAWLLIILCLFIIGTTFFMWHAKGYQLTDESFYTGIYSSTTDTGESSPIWSVRFMEHTFVHPLEVISGSVKITPIFRKTTVHEYHVEVKTPSRLVENTLYFPGWKIYIDGITTDLQFQDPVYRGLMTFRIPEGDHNVRVVFVDTKLRTVANMVSLISFGLLIVSATSVLLWRQRT